MYIRYNFVLIYFKFCNVLISYVFCFGDIRVKIVFEISNLRGKIVMVNVIKINNRIMVNEEIRLVIV